MSNKENKCIIEMEGEQQNQNLADAKIADNSSAPIFGLSNLAKLGFACPIFYKLIEHKDRSSKNIFYQLQVD